MTPAILRPPPLPRVVPVRQLWAVEAQRDVAQAELAEVEAQLERALRELTALRAREVLACG